MRRIIFIDLTSTGHFLVLIEGYTYHGHRVEVTAMPPHMYMKTRVDAPLIPFIYRAQELDMRWHHDHELALFWRSETIAGAIFHIVAVSWMTVCYSVDVMCPTSFTEVFGGDE
jgi:hypothetical protein